MRDIMHAHANGRRLCYRLPVQRPLPVAPGSGRNFGDLPVGHVWRAGEHITKIGDHLSDRPPAKAPAKR